LSQTGVRSTGSRASARQQPVVLQGTHRPGNKPAIVDWMASAAARGSAGVADGTPDDDIVGAVAKASATPTTRFWSSVGRFSTGRMPGVTTISRSSTPARSTFALGARGDDARASALASSARRARDMHQGLDVDLEAEVVEVAAV
jgi:hypothetical protein